MNATKRYMELLLPTAPQTTGRRFIFIVNNEDMALSIIGSGVCNAAAVDDEFTLDELLQILDANNSDFEKKQPYIFVPCLSKTQNEEIIKCCKDGLRLYEADGYSLFYKKEYLKQPEYAAELSKALKEYVQAHLGAADDEILSEEAIKAAAEEYKSSSNAYHLQNFLNGIKASADTPCISTGFTELDRLLDGGLYEGLYVFGAITSLGKTTFVQQIADNIAAAGKDVLYISLEMSRNELISKSISRHSYLNAVNGGLDMKLAKTARGITAGARYANYSREEKEAIETATVNYAEYSEHIYIHEGIGDIGTKKIRELVQQHKAYTGSSPVVVIDYMQILAPYNDRATDKQNADKNTMELKRLSREEKTPVICISSVNRANYLTPIDLESFKESGGIEYGSDVIIGLQFAVVSKNEAFDKEGKVKEKRELIREAKAKTPREIQAVILKNRQGKTGDTIDYNYYPYYNYFEEDSGFTAAPKGMRF